MSPSSNVGRWIRHHRKARDLTLGELAQLVGYTSSHLSMIETGRREPRLATVHALADALGVTAAELLSSDPPSRRDRLEIELRDSQQTAAYRALGLPEVRPNAGTSDATLEALVGLHAELSRRTEARKATPDEARRANVVLRGQMQRQMNYYGVLEDEARRLLAAVDHGGGPLGERRIAQLADHLGFEIQRVADLPQGVRSLTDERNGRIYLPVATGTTNPRATVLQALGHHVLGHSRPADFAEFLRQRVEVNYLAGALLIPENAAVDMLTRAKAGRYLAVEDLRDAFAVTYETAGHRFTNLVTHHLGLPVHFMKVHESGTVYKVYENDGLPMTTDSEGSAEGQFACRHRPARMAFRIVPPGTTLYQYFDTGGGTFWSSVQIDDAGFSVSVGVRFDDAQWFRGRETTRRSTSTCPDPACCRRPDPQLMERWERSSRPATTAHSSLLATLPPGAYPGVDDTEVYAFLDRHAPRVVSAVE